MYALDFAKRYVVYRIEEGDGPEDDDKVVVLAAYTKSYVANAAAKKLGAQVLDTQVVEPERLAYFNERTGGEFGQWVKVGDIAIHVAALNSLSAKVRLMLQRRYGLPVADMRPIVRCAFTGAVVEYYCEPEREGEIVNSVVSAIYNDPEDYLCVVPR